MRVVIASGGTGGHIYPGIALAQALKELAVEILFVGKSGGLESRIVKEEGFPFYGIPAEGVVGQKFSQIVTAFLKLLYASSRVFLLFLRYRPRVAVGTGGYVCGPVVGVAILLGIPTLIQEQNLVPGVTNRILGKLVKKIAISFPESADYFPRRKVLVTGNPIRKGIITASKSKALEVMGLQEGRFTILAMGGSQGAYQVNQAMVEALTFMRNENYQIIFLTGERDYRRVTEEVVRINPPNMKIIIRPYLADIASALAVSDLVIARSGATSIAEITARAIPAILVPFPFATHRHQSYNARWLERKGAAIVIPDALLSGGLLASVVRDLFSNSWRLEQMSTASKECGHPEATETISRLVMKMAGSG
jgi:UDP-N-acetylglucosamine--N-acetylmuramyl-(pentapeptide) pyrophosphoryl-undecaprenol N-acetylglucosamine transferase